MQKLNAMLLDVIVAVQSYHRFARDNSMLHQRFGESPKDILAETRNYYYGLDEGILEAAGLEKNLGDFEAVLDFDVTDAMLDTAPDALGKFSFD